MHALHRRLAPHGSHGVVAVDGEVVAIVSVWHADEGWGRVTIAASGEEVWTHFSTIEGRALGVLHVGEEVRLWCQPGPHPGELHAERVVPMSSSDPGAPEARPPGEAYHSSLTIIDDPE